MFDLHMTGLSFQYKITSNKECLEEDKKGRELYQEQEQRQRRWAWYMSNL